MGVQIPPWEGVVLCCLAVFRWNLALTTQWPVQLVKHWPHSWYSTDPKVIWRVPWCTWGRCQQSGWVWHKHSCNGSSSSRSEPYTLDTSWNCLLHHSSPVCTTCPSCWNNHTYIMRATEIGTCQWRKWAPYKVAGWARSTHAASALPAAASQAQSCLNNHRPISQHTVAGSVWMCAAQQQLLKPRLSLSCRRASGRCIAQSVAVFDAGRALDGPVVHCAVCIRARSTINPDGSSSEAASQQYTAQSSLAYLGHWEPNLAKKFKKYTLEWGCMYVCMYVCILWARVQPTLDPYAEALL